MIPHIPNQRQSHSNGSKPFDDLLRYIQKRTELTQAPNQEILSSQFGDILDYATNTQDQASHEEKCIAVRTHGVNSIETASAEMNAVAKQNTRVVDPVYHFILSWPEHEHPPAADVFDAAAHALRALGLHDHQYVVAIHGNTDNLHCHIAVNRVNPFTYASPNIQWAHKSLHRAARESEIKHGWSHDNGLYIVQVDEQGVKTVVENPGYTKAGKENAKPRGERGEDMVLPAWHDPESLDSWLKSTVAKELKRALPQLSSWQALHAWLDRHYISLSDTGGGGLRLHATSYETGEIIDMPASKGLRILKRADLEERWGAYRDPVTVPVSIPDFSPFTIEEINEGVDDVDNRIQGPNDEFIRFEVNPGGTETYQGGSLYELPGGDLDGFGQDGSLSLPDFGENHMDNGETRNDPSMRLPASGGGRGGSQEEQAQVRAGRDYDKRAQRREERAAARLDLRRRFAQYRQLVRSGSDEYFSQEKEIKAERRAALTALRLETEAARRGVPKSETPEVRLLSQLAIDTESTRRKLAIEARFQERNAELRSGRTMALGWREWLCEQASLGDQPALSALRGIVYQAQRDAKSVPEASTDDIEDEGAIDLAKQYLKVMARLLDEEKMEVAIRSARSSAMRAYEADVLLARYADIQWHVTGNGNVEYRAADGAHLFTDRGNRLTFDRVLVTDDDISLALLHAQQKFGRQLTLTGDDPIFTARMARLADDLGIAVLNPELQSVISQHRANRPKGIDMVATMSPAIQAAAQQVAGTAPGAFSQGQPTGSPQERLLDMVKAIDPRATFIDPSLNADVVQYSGPVVAELPDPGARFAQHLGRSVYAVHATSAPSVPEETVVDVTYRNGNITVSVPDQNKGRTI